MTDRPDRANALSLVRALLASRLQHPARQATALGLLSPRHLRELVDEHVQHLDGRASAQAVVDLRALDHTSRYWPSFVSDVLDEWEQVAELDDDRIDVVRWTSDEDTFADTGGEWVAEDTLDLGSTTTRVEVEVERVDDRELLGGFELFHTPTGR